jgi:hypothetical protein
MYAVVKDNVQFWTLQWTLGDPSSFFQAFKELMEMEDEPDTPYDLVELALDLFTLKYAVLETDTFELRFVRLTLPTAT